MTINLRQKLCLIVCSVWTKPSVLQNFIILQRQYTCCIVSIESQCFRSMVLHLILHQHFTIVFMFNFLFIITRSLFIICLHSTYSLLKFLTSRNFAGNLDIVSQIIHSTFTLNFNLNWLIFYLSNICCFSSLPYNGNLIVVLFH